MEVDGYNVSIFEQNITSATTLLLWTTTVISLEKNVFLVLLLATSLISFLASARVYHYLDLRSCQITRHSRKWHKCCFLAPQCWPCLSGGMFLALLFLDLFPAVNHSMAATGIDLDIFPIGQFIIVTSFLVVMFTEQVVLQWKEKEDEKEKAGGNCERSDEGITLLSKCRKTFLSQNIVRSLLLVLSLSVHNGLEGVSLGLAWSGSNSHLNLPTILYKSLTSSCVGFSLARLSPSLVMFQGLVYCVVSLGGVILALGVGKRMVGSGLDLAMAVLHGAAAGTFLYILFFEILPHQLNGPGRRLGKVFFVICGFFIAAGVVILT